MEKTVVGDKYVFVPSEEQKLADDCLQLLSEEVKRLNPDCEKVATLSFDDKIYVVPVDGNEPLMVMLIILQLYLKLSVEIFRDFLPEI